MSEENKKRPVTGEEPGGTSKGKKEGKLTFHTMFYHNSFILLFSFVSAVVIWFVMMAGNTESPAQIYDVPIEVNLSGNAEEEGLRVFKMSYTTADLEVTGSSYLTSKLSAADFKASVTLNPTSTKLTGNTMQKMTLPVKVVKNSEYAEYSVKSVNPQEVNVEYDRYKETTLTIEDQLTYSADTAGYYAGKATFSDEKVTISGPESSVNKISRAVVQYTVTNALREDYAFSTPIRLYDQNNQEITDFPAAYLTLSVDTLDVVIPVSAKKTVTLVPNVINRPKSFGEGRISVEPAQIEITGAQDVLKNINEITLAQAVDFSSLDASKKNEFEMEISLPPGVRSLTNLGTDGVSKAKVSVNLNGYQQVKVTTRNITIAKTVAGKDVAKNTDSIEVTIIGSEAQVAKLTGDAISCSIDPTNFAERNGSTEVPVTVTVSGSGFDSCWAVGQYTAFITITDKTTAVVPGGAKADAGVAATPQQ